MRIDLRSDTATRPTAAMRQAMAAAEVGDEQLGEDPSVARLCARVADLLGQPAALFLPSGTMCNLIAVAVHCRPGDEILAAEASHLFNAEAGGPAAIVGAQIRPLPGDRGRFTADEVAARLRPPRHRAPRSRLVAIEQTVNEGGGAVWSPTAMAEVATTARAAGLAVHVDGARLLNATVALGLAPAVFGRLADSVWIDLSKGLGCPIGGVLAGDAAFIEAAWTWKHRLGGAMRQAGIAAAAGLHALDHHVERLALDHANARDLARLLAAIPGVRMLHDMVDTNIVFFDVADTGWNAGALAAALAEDGVGVGPRGTTGLRAVTHLDVSATDIAEAARLIAQRLAHSPATARDEVAHVRPA
jgi:threonine aldolase